MSIEKEDDDLKGFMNELEESCDVKFGSKTKEDIVQLEPISEEDFEKRLMAGVAMLLESCTEVSHELKTRIKSGDNYEGTMMGFAQSTDNTIKALKFIETRRNLKLKEEIDQRKMATQQDHRLAIEDKKNEGKALSNVKNLTQNNNTFVGNPDEFFKRMQNIEAGIDVEEVSVVEED
jgi:hypothetical protein